MDKKKKEKAVSCHIPSDKEVRYTRGEVKLQKPGAVFFFLVTDLCRKWSFVVATEKLTALSSIPTQDKQWWKKKRAETMLQKEMDFRGKKGLRCVCVRES